MESGAAVKSADGVRIFSGFSVVMVLAVGTAGVLGGVAISAAVGIENSGGVGKAGSLAGSVSEDVCEESLLWEISREAVSSEPRPLEVDLVEAAKRLLSISPMRFSEMSS